MRPTAYRRNAHHLRARHAFEGIRMQAGALFAAGHSQAEVALDLGAVSRRRHRVLGRVGRLAVAGDAADLGATGSSPVIRPTSSGGGPVAVVSSDHTTGRKGWLASPIPTWEVLQVSGHAAMLVAGRQHAGDRRSSGDGREPW
jgi:hypothetical protein